MLKTEYSRGINKSSLLLTPEKDYGAEIDSIEMFRYNQIPYFLNMEPKKKNITLQFCYDITGRRSLGQLLEYKPLDYMMLRRILNSLDQACLQAEDFMMTENDILLEPEFVFVDHSGEQMGYCYLPGNQVDICGQFKTFMEYLLKTLNHKDEQAVQFAYTIYQQVVEERTALHEVLKQEMQGKQERALLEQSHAVQYVAEDTQPLFHGHQTVNSPELQPRQMDCETGYAQAETHGRREDVKREDVKREDVKRDEYSVWKQVRQDTEEKESTFNPLHDKMGVAQQADRYRDDAKELMGKEPVQEKLIEQEFADVKQEPVNGKPLKRKQSGSPGKMEPALQEYRKEHVSNIQQKETLRKQAAERLKHMLRKKIYTDRVREEETVFEAEEEEQTSNSNPTVCLMPETDGIQNRFVYQGADRSRDFCCRKGKMILGSDLQESDICISMPLVSRVHARVDVDAQGAFLEDMNSTNGTYVNGELLQYKERRMLQKGDIISLAGESYSFH